MPQKLGHSVKLALHLVLFENRGFEGAVREQIMGKPLGVLIFGKETVFKSYFWVNS